MTAAGIVAFLSAQGFRVGLTADRQSIGLTLAPTDDRLRARILARRDDVLAYLRELTAPAATAHAFAAWTSADRKATRERGVCIACGIPWEMHGSPPIETWSVTDDPDSVALIQAAAIVVGVVAAARAVETLGKGIEE